MLTENLFSEYQNRIEHVLDAYLPAADLNPKKLHQAMRYATLEGGKRIRALLVYATGQALHIPLERLDPIATAVEMLHAYSLIHDDLPAMDDDDLRRGKPTLHKAFDEATAILAGDALQALAFHILVEPQAENAIPAEKRLEIIHCLTLAAGSRGMAGGQAIDLDSVGKTLTEPELENMHIHKTGALMRASVLMAALCKNELATETRQGLDHFAKCVGLAFQVRDDILDIESDTETLGKTQGADKAANKPTYPSIIGLEASRQRAHDLYHEALKTLDSLDESADLLRTIAKFIVIRLK